MTDSPASPRDYRKIFKIVGYTIGAIALITVIAGAVFLSYLAESLSPPKKEPTVHPRDIPVLEDQLRTKGSAEDARTRYEATLQSIADKLTQLLPNLTWQWKRDVMHLGCAGDLAETRGIRVITTKLVASEPIPDDSWPTARQIVGDAAAELGATHQHIYANKPGHHDIAFYADNGAEIRLVTGLRTVLGARSDCYLKQADL